MIHDVTELVFVTIRDDDDDAHHYTWVPVWLAGPLLSMM